MRWIKSRIVDAGMVDRGECADHSLLELWLAPAKCDVAFIELPIANNGIEQSSRQSTGYFPDLDVLSERAAASHESASIMIAASLN